MTFTGKTIVVTGAASGIGRALLGQLSRYVCTIVAADIDEKALDTAVAELIHTPAQISAVVADLATPEGTTAVLDAAAERKPIDLVFANAGFGRYGTLDTTGSWDDLEAMFRLNVLAPIWTAKLLRERYPDHPYRLVITASVMSLVGLPGYAAYGATKGALHRFADAYRYELGDRAALTLVYPVATETPFFERADGAPLPWPHQTAEEVARATLRGVEQGRATISPSRLFSVYRRAGPLRPLIARIIQQREKWRLNAWLRARGEPPV
ncbi:MAG: SDR family NAD(P)-dependent oxidoreductase [Trueperaceae bacterium]|nr:SDR family NAD(P)-dependent oxidoreductase [Trueperaceae bacterium]